MVLAITTPAGARFPLAQCGCARGATAFTRHATFCARPGHRWQAGRLRIIDPALARERRRLRRWRTLIAGVSGRRRPACGGAVHRKHQHARRLPAHCPLRCQ
ncbi:hypothetical protein ACU4GD_17840 [Cupriavidus basilensis]